MNADAMKTRRKGARTRQGRGRKDFAEDRRAAVAALDAAEGRVLVLTMLVHTQESDRAEAEREYSAAMATVGGTRDLLDEAMEVLANLRRAHVASARFA